MYRRFLNNDDYLGIITPEALAQLTRGNDARFIQAEESAEMSIVEYLSENYEIEKELAKGKYIAEYDRRSIEQIAKGMENHRPGPKEIFGNDMEAFHRGL